MPKRHLIASTGKFYSGCWIVQGFPNQSLLKLGPYTPVLVPISRLMAPYLSQYLLTMALIRDALRAIPDIQGLSIQQHEFKLSLQYKWMTCCYMSPTPGLSSHFCSENSMHLAPSVILRLTHNSEVLNVTLSTAEVAHLTSTFPSPWQRVALTYLGIKLPSDTSLIYELNYKPLLVAMTCKLCEWVTPSHWWFGRITLFKMDILPRILCFSDGPHVGSQNLFPHI